jgi:hypothetical protein
MSFFETDELPETDSPAMAAVSQAGAHFALYRVWQNSRGLARKSLWTVLKMPLFFSSGRLNRCYF